MLVAPNAGQPTVRFTAEVLERLGGTRRRAGLEVVRSRHREGHRPAKAGQLCKLGRRDQALRYFTFATS